MGPEWVSATATTIASIVALYISTKRYKPPIYMSNKLEAPLSSRLYAPEEKNIIIKIYNISTVKTFLNTVYIAPPVPFLANKFKCRICNKSFLYDDDSIDNTGYDYCIEYNDIKKKICNHSLFKACYNLNKNLIKFFNIYITLDCNETYSCRLHESVWRYICHLMDSEITPPSSLMTTTEH